MTRSKDNPQLCVLTDFRERASGLPALLRQKNVDVRLQQLDAGDYIISDRLVVERKTTTDLDGSIMDRRFFDQVQRMTENWSRVVVLWVEDHGARLPVHGRRGALSWAIRQGASIIHVESNEEAAAWIHNLARQEQESGHKPAISRSAPKRRKQVHQQAEDVIMMLPGIGPKTAQALLQHFGSARNLFAADEKALRAAPGVGKTRARQIAAVLDFASALDETS